MSAQLESSWQAKIQSAKGLVVKNQLISSDDIDAIVNLLGKDAPQWKVLSLENATVSEQDLADLFASLSSSQNSLEEISLIDQKNSLSSKSMFQLFNLIQAQSNLEKLDLSKNKFASSNFGQILLALKKSKKPIKLILNEVPFNEEDESNFLSSVEKGIKLSSLTAEGSMISKDKINSLISSRVSTSQTPATAPPARRKFIMDFSTEEKAKTVPQFLIKCECERKLNFHEIFSCPNCKKSQCKFCSKNSIFCHVCFYCSKFHMPSATNVRVRMRNICSNCLQCPNCFNNLQTQEKEPGKASFYCNFCFWNSRNYGMERSSNEELMTDHYNLTNISNKNLEALMKTFIESQLAISTKRAENPLVIGVEQELKKVPEVTASRETRDLREFKDAYWDYKLPSSLIATRFPLFSTPNDANNIPEHLENPVFYKFYQKDKDAMSKTDYIDKFKQNDFNLRLFRAFPVKVYTEKSDFYVPKRKLNAYIRKNCKTCFQSFVNFEQKSDEVTSKNTAYFIEASPLFDLLELKLLDDKSEPKKYKATIRVLSFAACKFKIQIEPGQNCEKLPENSKISFEFDLNVDAAVEINPMRISAAAVAANSAKTFSVVFFVSANAPKVFFSLKLNKALVLQNEVVTNDELFVDFTTMERFKAYLDVLASF